MPDPKLFESVRGRWVILPAGRFLSETRFIGYNGRVGPRAVSPEPCRNLTNEGVPSMPTVKRRLVTDSDFQEAMERQAGIRVFRDDHIVHSGGSILRFDEDTLVIQAGVSDLSYFGRAECEIFELK